MKNERKAFSDRWKTIGLLFIGFILGAVVAHIIWFVAVQGLIESDVRAALFTGANITGNVVSLERYEDGYLAVVETVDYGNVSVKISVEEEGEFKVGSAVTLSCDLTLKNYVE